MVHATENIRVRGGVEAFAEVALEALLVEDGTLNGFDEVAAIVVEDGELHDIAAGQLGFGELNSAVDGACHGEHPRTRWCRSIRGSRPRGPACGRRNFEWF